MEIEIEGKKYRMEVKGTIGLVYLAERMLGEEYKNGNSYHMMTLYYCCLRVSNAERADLPDLMTFIASMTSAKLNRIGEYFWSEWEKLEGTKKEEGNPEGED